MREWNDRPVLFQPVSTFEKIANDVVSIIIILTIMLKR